MAITPIMIAGDLPVNTASQYRHSHIPGSILGEVRIDPQQA